ncbi:MAG: pilus assembly protein TadG-related protein [Desulfobaccales bacterium]
MRTISSFIRKTEGATAVVIAIGIFTFLGLASLAIDVGHLYTVRNQLQNSADAVALAGVEQLIQADSNGDAVVNSTQATAAAMQVAQSQSQLDGLPTVTNAARNDLTLNFGVWNIYAGNPNTAWTLIGPTCTSTSNANALQVTLTRNAGTVFGPVTNFFAQIFGLSNSTVSATATAYLGYTNQVQTGAIQVPLALPSTGTGSPLASNGDSGWFARLFGPNQAAATTTKTLIFKDTGGAKVPTTVPTSPVANLDPNQGYFYTVNSTDTVPTTITNTLAKIYTPSLTAQTNIPVLVGALTVNQQVYPRSEYPWGGSYMGAIFQNLQKAYYYKTTGSATTAPAAGTAWHTTLVVHTPTSTAPLARKGGFMSLARLLAPFWASEAYACSTLTTPTIKVASVVNVAITGVTYNNTSSGDGTSYTFPKTIATPAPASGTTTYTSLKDYLTRYPNSTWNLNSVTIQSVTDTATVSPAGSVSGGPANNTINTGAPANVGSFARTGKLVKNW